MPSAQAQARPPLRRGSPQQSRAPRLPDQGSASAFCKGPGGRCFRLCGLWSLRPPFTSATKHQDARRRCSGGRQDPAVFANLGLEDSQPALPPGWHRPHRESKDQALPMPGGGTVWTGTYKASFNASLSWPPPPTASAGPGGQVNSCGLFL